MRTRFESGMALLALTLFNIISYLNLEMFQQRSDQTVQLAQVLITFFALTSFAALLLPQILQRPIALEKSLFARLGDKTRLVLLAALLAFITGSRFAGLEVWMHSTGWRLTTIAGYCFAGPLAYGLFFLNAPARRRGLWFGAALSAGIAAKIAVSAMLGSDEAWRPSNEKLALLYPMLAMLTAVMAMALMVGFSGIMARPPQPAETAKSGLLDSDSARWKIMLGMLGTVSLFYIMNGFLSARLMPLLDQFARRQFGPLPALVVLFCPLTGWLIDRDPERWLRRLLPLCALVLMVAPSLAVLGASTFAYQAVHTLASLCQFVLFVSATLAMAGLSRPGPWWLLLACGPSICRIFSLPGIVLHRYMHALDFGLLVTGSIVLAAAFYHLARKVCDYFDLASTRSGQSPVVTPEEQFAAHGLTARETEVAERIFLGMSTAEISRQLSISENTVNTHAKNILRKFDLGSRKALVAKIVAGQAPEPYGETPESLN